MVHLIGFCMKSVKVSKSWILDVVLYPPTYQFSPIALIVGGLLIRGVAEKCKNISQISPLVAAHRALFCSRLAFPHMHYDLCRHLKSGVCWIAVPHPNSSLWTITLT
ncbi:hypothetical protein GDO78_010542 [Eleutherodactylus coqui]|uniref:Uncharacterized protein n=1 Tax=Eleutherodactylus coqui TaxID=57060 RepID=A0A8J6K7D0_ELECQ|nr:hypothetical protein GDO78_010542 [Eleutherodactylus coqui]